MTSKTTYKSSGSSDPVRMVQDNEGDHASRWGEVVSISAKIGCTRQTLHEWVKRAEIDSGKRSGVPSDVPDRLKALERENRELRQASLACTKLTPYSLVCCANCFLTKQVVGDAGLTKPSASSARAVHYS